MHRRRNFSTTLVSFGHRWIGRLVGILLAPAYCLLSAVRARAGALPPCSRLNLSARVRRRAF
eukprot:5928477-Pleurochrysis_carterae.AAC.1